MRTRVSLGSARAGGKEEEREREFAGGGGAGGRGAEEKGEEEEEEEAEIVWCLRGKRAVTLGYDCDPLLAPATSSYIET